MAKSMLLRVQVISADGDQHRLLAAPRRGALLTGTTRRRASQSARAILTNATGCPAVTPSGYLNGYCGSNQHQPAASRQPIGGLAASRKATPPCFPRIHLKRRTASNTGRAKGGSIRSVGRQYES